MPASQSNNYTTDLITHSKTDPTEIDEETVRRRKAAESREVETPFGFHADILHFFFSGIPCHLEAPPSSLFFIYKAWARVIYVLQYFLNTVTSKMNMNAL